MFLDILAHGRDPQRTLTLMNEAGVLGRFLPEFGRIVAQMQFNMYHSYTVDEHTLRAVGSSPTSPPAASPRTIRSPPRSCR